MLHLTVKQGRDSFILMVPVSDTLLQFCFEPGVSLSVWNLSTLFSGPLIRITKNFFRSTCILVMLKMLISMDEIIVL